MSTRASRSDSSAFASWTWSDAEREAVKSEPVIGSDLFHKTQRSLQQDKTTLFETETIAGMKSVY